MTKLYDVKFTSPNGAEQTANLGGRRVAWLISVSPEYGADDSQVGDKLANNIAALYKAHRDNNVVTDLLLTTELQRHNALEPGDESTLQERQANALKTVQEWDKKWLAEFQKSVATAAKILNEGKAEHDTSRVTERQINSAFQIKKWKDILPIDQLDKGATKGDNPYFNHRKQIDDKCQDKETTYIKFDNKTFHELVTDASAGYLNRVEARRRKSGLGNYPDDQRAFKKACSERYIREESAVLPHINDYLGKDEEPYDYMFYANRPYRPIAAELDGSGLSWLVPKFDNPKKKLEEASPSSSGGNSSDENSSSHSTKGQSNKTSPTSSAVESTPSIFDNLPEDRAGREKELQKRKVNSEFDAKMVELELERLRKLKELDSGANSDASSTSDAEMRNGSPQGSVIEDVVDSPKSISIAGLRCDTAFSDADEDVEAGGYQTAVELDNEGPDTTTPKQTMQDSLSQDSAASSILDLSPKKWPKGQKFRSLGNKREDDGYMTDTESDENGEAKARKGQARRNSADKKKRRGSKERREDAKATATSEPALTDDYKNPAVTRQQGLVDTGTTMTPRQEQPPTISNVSWFTSFIAFIGAIKNFAESFSDSTAASDSSEYKSAYDVTGSYATTPIQIEPTKRPKRTSGFVSVGGYSTPGSPPYSDDESAGNSPVDSSSSKKRGLRHTASTAPA